MPKSADISYNELRQTIGWLGILLPIIVYFNNLIVSDCHNLQDSISHYYYTVSNVWFVGIFWGLGLVLLFYPSYTNEPNNDGMWTSIAGICAICVSLFPTDSNSADSCAVFMLEESSLRTGFHYLSAAVMLSIFSYMSIKIFTRTKPGNDLTSEENKWKRKRNTIYIVAGWLTLSSIVLIGVISAILFFYPTFKISSKYTFWLEVAALIPFGISWLIKGGFALTDVDETSTLEKGKNMVLGQSTSPKKEIK